MERARPSRLPLRSGGNARNRRVRKEPARKSPAQSRRRESDPPAPNRLRSLRDRKEILAVFLIASSVFFGLAFGSYDAATGGNLVGKAGAFLAKHLFGVFGLGAFVLPLTLFFGFLAVVRPQGKRLGMVTALAYLALLVGASVLLDLLVPSLRLFGARPGGSLGGAASDAMAGVFSLVGTVILVSATMAAALVIATGLEVSKIALFAGAVGKKLGIWFAGFVHAQLEQHRAEREARLEEEEAALAEEEALAAAAFQAALEEAEEGAAPPKRKGRKRVEEPSIEADLDGRVAVAPEEPPAKAVVVAPLLVAPGVAETKKARPAPPPPPVEPATPPAPLLPPDPAWAASPAPIAPAAPIAAESPAAPAPLEKVEPVEAIDPSSEAAAEPPPPALDVPPAAVQALVKAGKLPPAAPVIELPKAPPAPKKSDSPFDLIASEGGFSLPPLSLLDGHGDEADQAIDEALLHSTAEKLRQKLADFGIQGQVERIRPGPVVTMYEFAPAPGVKISKIAGLSDDLAMALEALRVRIVAPIPGRGVVGIEVPNKKRETVYLRDILEQDAFRMSKSRLTMAVGKDIEGMPFVADLARMPHLLMSGTTGSGKSVSVNSMIMSLLFKATPEEVRFIMVDPKMLELSIYEGIPHLLLPVVTDPRKAALALRWAVDEMERRYALLAENGVRDLAGFNKLMAEKLEARESAGSPPPAAPTASPRKVLIIDVEKGETDEEALARSEQAELDGPGAAPDEEPLDPVEAFLEKKHQEELEPKKLPYLVIIIDELADLMMVASKEVETYIARIAQKARAAGIHLMVATQRPSVDVITGLIKANFPSRISFALRSRIDSMTILDTPGAEKLLGQGDMLILPPTSAHIQRVHGALVTEKEIKRVVDHLKAQGSPVYDESILKAPDEDVEGGGADDDLSDELYDQAIAIVSEMKSVSISMLQRKMRIGYNRSARMIEKMEREGIVGPADGAKPREVLIRGIGDMPNV
ncbi:DNA translocase FtsK [Vulgatibacter incomptus]|uniref:Cell division protein FtsK n=1 Tax=Vulgatibacter incomptus TaxID=1391653 RepID=A0A0K1PIE2_9BACT|nr:DNA translocase FtsK [Vulgatibacter incomptus]AKU93313.1 Cell division protein FtsK [Vulgatibacter incomptus]